MTTSAIFIPHGGGPLPLLGDPAHSKLVEFLKQLGQTLPRPEAIICISAHFEAPAVTLTSAERPGMVYDYYGFRPKAYELQYAAPGAPFLAEEIAETLCEAGVKTVTDSQRGFDHGTFAPLMLLYPDANIPVTQLSLHIILSPTTHIKRGEALADFKDRNYLILGSGMSFHNMQAFMNPSQESRQASADFQGWLIHALTSKSMEPEDRLARLANWASAPSARYCHPREEHLLPLHVCAGYGEAAGLQAKIIFDDLLLDHYVLGAHWS